MSQSPDQNSHVFDEQADAPADESSVLPCAEALLAGTLALMTGHADACCEDHRNLMASKAASNLFLLSHHPLMSEGFKTLAWKLHMQWGHRIKTGQTPAAELADNAEPTVSNDDNTCDGSPDNSISNNSSGDTTAVHSSRALWHTTPETIQ